MAREIPEVVRAAAGLAAALLDETRKLPEALPGLPVRVIGFAMQKAMWLQQHYSGLVARGDELFTGVRGEEEPGLATFDDDLPAEEPDPAAGYRESAFDRAAEPTEDDLLAGLPEDDAADELADAALEELALEELVDDEPAATPDSTPADTPAATTVVRSGGPATAPVDGYEDWSIAQLRGRLRGYAPSTVQEILDYEEGTRAREPYLRMLRNSLGKGQPETA